MMVGEKMLNMYPRVIIGHMVSLYASALIYCVVQLYCVVF